MADVFHEVDEQLRSARFQSLLRRGWPYAVGLIVAAGLAGLVAWALNQHEMQQAAVASARYADAMQAMQKGDLAGAETGFADIARTAPRAYRTLALMQEAGLRLRRSDDAGALSMLDQAAQAAPNAIMADTVRLEAAYVAMDSRPYAEARQRLLPLTPAGRPLRIMAREALGLAELADGRIAEAKGDLQVVSLSTDASDMGRNRASAALSLIDSGAWTSIAPLAKASAGLKPQAPPPQTQVGAGQADPNQSASNQAGAAQDQAAPQAGAAQ